MGPLPAPELLARIRALPYVRPKQGRDWWVVDGALREPDAVRARALARTDWAQGRPARPEPWPGMRAADSLLPHELASLDRTVRKLTGARVLAQPRVPAGDRLDHNTVQVVGAGESGPLPHTDSRALCTYAAVLYLNPAPTAHCGTTFFRLRVPGGDLGGNTVEAPQRNLVSALGVTALPADAFVPDVAVANVYNRLLVYRANLIHSATGYFGTTLADKRMTTVFFWLSR